MPGFEGNLNIKWLRRLKFGDQPWMTRWETARYTQFLTNVLRGVVEPACAQKRAEAAICGFEHEFDEWANA